MKAEDVMVPDVVVVRPQDTVRDAAAILLKAGISAAPVIGEDGGLLGILSEGDLMRRAEIGTDRRRSWWLDLLSAPETRAEEFVRAHALKVADVMTTPVTTCGPNGTTADCAAVMSHQRIRHLPVVEGGKLVGMISTGDLLAAQMVENIMEQIDRFTAKEEQHDDLTILVTRIG